MIGFDSIGQGAIGELTGDPDTVVFAPVGFVATVTTAVPVVRGGGSVLTTGKAVAVAAAAPAIRAGVRVAPQTASVAVASAAAAVAISATVTVPPAAVAVTKTAPFIGSGVLLSPPVVNVTVTKGAAPFVAAGKSVAPTAASVAVAARTPGISISARITPPTIGVVATSPPASIVGGNYIDARNTITMVTPYGEIGSASIGQFSIGEGEVSSRIVLRSPLITVSIASPFITAGKTILPPSRTVSVAAFRPEIDSRGRKLRVLAIAS